MCHDTEMLWVYFYLYKIFENLWQIHDSKHNVTMLYIQKPNSVLIIMKNITQKKEQKDM